MFDGTDEVVADVPISNEFDLRKFESGYGPSLAAVTADQQRAFESVPWIAHFHPAIFPPVLGFDPNTIQDIFDPFSYLVEDANADNNKK